jgi:hypothetical protein
LLLLSSGGLALACLFTSAALSPSMSSSEIIISYTLLASGTIFLSLRLLSQLIRKKLCWIVLLLLTRDQEVKAPGSLLQRRVFCSDDTYSNSDSKQMWDILTEACNLLQRNKRADERFVSDSLTVVHWYCCSSYSDPPPGRRRKNYDFVRTWRLSVRFTQNKTTGKPMSMVTWL